MQILVVTGQSGVGAFILIVLGLVGAAGLWRWIPRYVPREPRHPAPDDAERDEGWTPAADT